MISTVDRPRCWLVLAAFACLVPVASGAPAEKSKPAAANSAAKAPQPDKDGWYSLFNGKDFTGWKFAKENHDTFKVVDGQIVVNGPRCHIFYDGPVNHANFKNFELKADVLTKPHSNSGIYFHTRYQAEDWPHYGIEAQINNTHPDPRKTGSLYRAHDVMDVSPAKDNEWFNLHLVVKDRHCVVKINGKTVNDHVEPEHPQREEGWENNVLSEGTFALQGHDPGSEVHFKNIKVKPLP
jgi:hypothetical protein